MPRFLSCVFSLFAVINALEICSDITGPLGRTLDCRNRSLLRVPENLPTNGVTSLLLRRNKITVIMSGTFENFTDLLNLDLSGNKLYDLETDAFRGLTNLQTLDIGLLNKFITWPDQPLSALHSVTTLTMSAENDLDPEPLPISLQNITHLEHLTIDVTVLVRIDALFFLNLCKTNIRSLFISAVQTVDKDAFKCFKSLQELGMLLVDVDGTSLFNMMTSLGGSPLISLDLSKSVISEDHLTRYMFSQFTNNSLQTLDMSSTRMSYVEDGTFSPFNCLETLNMKQTLLTVITPKTFLGLDNLVYLDLSDSVIDFWYFDTKIFTFNSLEKLHISYSYFSVSNHRLSGQFFPLLRELYVDQGNDVSVREMSRLEILECINCVLDTKRLPLLNTLHLIDSTLPVAYPYNRTMFEGMGHLNTVYLECLGSQDLSILGFNFVGKTLTELSLIRCHIKHVAMETFKYLEILEMLDLSGNVDITLSRAAFSNNHKLKVLRLSHIPKLNQIPEAAMMLHLEILDVSSCGIPWFSKADMKYLESYKVSTLYASDNPFFCSCDLQPFIEWFKHTPKISEDRYLYTCSSGTHLDDVELFDCHHLVVILSVTLSVILLCAVLCVVAYRRRWTLRWMWYLIRLKRYQQMEEAMENDPDIEYDAFVSYSNHDYRFVLNHLMPHLEGDEAEDERFRLALDFREFTPGIPIVDNIVNYINKSRKTLIMLSNNFINSNWTMFEYEMSRSKLAERKNVVIILIMEPIGHRMSELPKSLNELLKKKLYIEWTTDPRGQQLFWKKLRRALQRPSRIRYTES